MNDIAYFRNQLANKKFGSYELLELKKLKEKIETNTFPFNQVIMFGINNCIVDYENNQHESALWELQMIHNVPASKNEYDKWNQESFYTIEILGYLEMTSDFNRVKKYIRLLSDAEKSV